MVEALKKMAETKASDYYDRLNQKSTKGTWQAKDKDVEPVAYVRDVEKTPHSK